MRSFLHHNSAARARLVLAAAVILGIGSAAVSASGAAAPAGQAAKGPVWNENTGMTLHVTEPAPKAGVATSTGGEVYDRADYQAMLLLPASGELAYILDLKTQQVAAYAKPTLLDAEGNLRPGTPAAARPVGPFDTSPEGRIRFLEGGRDFIVEAAPPLVGPIDRADLLARYPGYARRAAAYRPDPAMVAKLAAVKLPAKIVVFFGTWCQICRHELPALMATLDAAKNPNFTLALVALDENVVEPKDLISQYRVLTTPTTIVLVDGQELGRIEEEPKVSAEADLAGILVGPGADGR